MYTQQDISCMQHEIDNSLAGALGICLIPSPNHNVVATMPVDTRTCRPNGLLNGGASIAMAETLAGFGSRMLCPQGKEAVGMQVTANHLSMALLGDVVTGTARPFHLGRSTHIWDIEVVSAQTGKLISSVRVVNFIIDTKQK